MTTCFYRVYRYHARTCIYIYIYCCCTSLSRAEYFIIRFVSVQYGPQTLHVPLTPLLATAAYRNNDVWTNLKTAGDDKKIQDRKQLNKTERYGNKLWIFDLRLSKMVPEEMGLHHIWRLLLLVLKVFKIGKSAGKGRRATSALRCSSGKDNTPRLSVRPLLFFFLAFFGLRNTRIYTGIYIGVLHFRRNKKKTVFGRPFPRRFDCSSSDFDPIAFSGVNLANRKSLPRRKKNRCIVCVEIRAIAETICWYCALAPRRARCWRCPARRTQASEPRLTNCLWSGGEETWRVR